MAPSSRGLDEDRLLAARAYGDVHWAPNEIARLKAKVSAQARRLRDQAASLDYYEKIFEQASAVARIGVWECSLPDEKLRWSDQVYDMFDLPRRSVISRDQILSCYSSQSLSVLQKLRGDAIRERGGFSLDAQITTPQGRWRWIRLTATVECDDGRPIRIFGMKQDITEEKVLADRTRYLAEFDILTGLANRASFQAKLADFAGRRNGDAGSGALLLVDLDNFKHINDSLGHTFGDECLKSVAVRLRGACQGADLVARIGGDEFAVLFGAPIRQSSIEAIARRIVDDMHAPMTFDDWSFQTGASVGIARLDRASPSELFTQADVALYAAKAAGRNTFRTYDPKAVYARHPRQFQLKAVASGPVE